MEFTNNDPASELASVKDLIFVSESGDDNNDGLTVDTPVKTLGAAYALVNGQTEATFAVNGRVAMGNVSGDYSGLSLTVGTFNGTGTLLDFQAQGNTTLTDVVVDGDTRTNGYDVVFA